MSLNFIVRLIGVIICSFLGIQVGTQLATSIHMTVQESALLFFLIGALIGLIATPWVTIFPVRFIRKMFLQMPIERLLMALLGGASGLLLMLLFAYPLSLLGDPFGKFFPSIASLLGAYLGLTIFSVRAQEILDSISSRFGSRKKGVHRTRELLLDTSALIDGRIADIADTGFLGGILIIPRFVIGELHRGSDSSDPIRRNRFRRGLSVLNKLQQGDMVQVRIIDDDFDNIPDVDNKLIALAIQTDGMIVTNDYNLNKVAGAQGITVLNVNLLANAVRSVYIPGEEFAIRIIQAGTDPEQGIGYLDDGTMVVVEQGANYMDRTVNVTVTKLINRETGRMIFATAAADKH